ncbi:MULTISPECIES: nuclear transport factor 2 family protein [Pseudomonas]|uniref:nuclear transport factor 2 family protein n=1 Tax=Pseudomonas TaxID=286 RepID=UPI0015B9C6EC|nr:MULTISPECIES: nuclear transport factor 2 family protein [Pseudomonas]MDH4846113.1 nuclear transport factor 2 family protein [Pseudomonas sp. BN605]MDH4858785.1 nuclear transport factor 2 family protein [Pseudomonas sp. BN505]NWL08064.1 nuclear transport factor 2 family protein [Pseudomonas hunanensis]
MQAEFQSLLDKQQIYEVLATYCRGVDRCDIELVRSAYHPDSYDDHGYWAGPGWEFADFVVQRLMEANTATMHSLGNVLIDITEDGIARSEAYVTVTLVRRNTNPPKADVMGARYVDRLSKREGLWKIEERTVVLDWTKVETWDDTAAAIPLDQFAWGERGNRRDPTYVMLRFSTLQN